MLRLVIRLIQDELHVRIAYLFPNIACSNPIVLPPCVGFMAFLKAVYFLVPVSFIGGYF